LAKLYEVTLFLQIKNQSVTNSYIYVKTEIIQQHILK